MREILFRGKIKDNGEWVYGFYCPICFGFFPCSPAIISKELMDSGCWRPEEVIPETVGQYTGLTVPSGNIFEHDIVTAKFKSNGARFNFTVKYSNENGCYVFDNGCVKVPFNDIRSVRKIGNIHDNPELLKEGDGK